MTKPLLCPEADEAHALFHAFRADIRAKLAQGTLGQSVIGKGKLVEGPLGKQPMLYAD